MIQLYFASGSPFAWRVHLALEEKGLSYESKLLSFQSGDPKKPEYLAISPHGKVPAIVDGTLSLYESQAIVEYLEEKYPEKPLLPREPEARALVRVEELECVLYFAEAFLRVARQAFFTPPDKRDEKALRESREEVRRLLFALDSRCAKRGSEFVCGKGFSRADITWIPFVEIASRAGVDLDAAAMPWLTSWRARMRARPTYERTYPPHWRK
jgi:glutathione S-transferase